MDLLNHSTLYWTCHYLSMLGLKLIHVSKRGHSYTDSQNAIHFEFGTLNTIFKQATHTSMRVKVSWKEPIKTIYMWLNIAAGIPAPRMKIGIRYISTLPPCLIYYNWNNTASATSRLAYPIHCNNTWRGGKWVCRNDCSQCCNLWLSLSCNTSQPSLGWIISGEILES